MRITLLNILVLIPLFILVGCGGAGKPSDEVIQKLITSIYEKGNRPGYAFITTMPVVTNQWEDENIKGAYNITLSYTSTFTNSIDLNGRRISEVEQVNAIYRFVKMGDQWSAPKRID